MIFGDYMKIGASDADRLYEEINLKKVTNILSEVMTLPLYHAIPYYHCTIPFEIIILCFLSVFG